MPGKHSETLVFSSILKTIIVNVSKRLKFLASYVIISVTFKVNKYQIAINPLRKNLMRSKKRRKMMKNRKFFIFTALTVICLMFAALSGCKGCGKDKDHAHVYGEWTITKEATCTEEGIATRKCAKCDKTESKAVPRKDHDFGELVAGTEKTCETDGTLSYYECKTCKGKYDVTKTKRLTDLTVRKGHNITSSKAAVPATCLTEGNYEYSYCSACNKYLDKTGKELKTVVIPKLDHDFTDGHFDYAEATCETDGHEEYYKCNLCDKYYTGSEEYGYDEVNPSHIFHPKTNHANKRYVAAEAPSCGGDGTNGVKEHFRCDDCGKNFDLKGNVVPDESLVIAYKHDLKYKAAVASTCTEDGVKEYYYCADCGRSYSDETATTLTGDLTVKATGHSFYDPDGKPDKTKYIQAKAATETENGCIAHYHCDNCDKNFDEAGEEVGNVILIYNHNLVWVDEFPMSCGGMIEGKKAHYECSDAGCHKYFDAAGNEVSLDSLTIPVTHVFGELIKANKGDCGHREVKEDYYKCEICELYHNKNGERIAGIDLFGDYGDHIPTYVYCNEYRHNEICSVCGTVMGDDLHSGNTEYYLNASGEHVKKVECSYCGYISGETAYFAAEDAVIEPVIAGKKALEWTRVIFFSGGGRDSIYKDFYELLTDEELTSLREFMNAFIADAAKTTATREVTVVYENFSKTLPLCFIKPEYELNKVYTKEKKYDVNSLESLDDVDYVMYTINGEIYIYSYNVTISDEDKQRFVQTKAMLKTGGGERRLTYDIVEGSGDNAVPHRVSITLTSETPVYVTDFSVENEVLTGSRPKITTVFYSNSPYVGESPDGDVYCDEYYFIDFNKPGRYGVALKYGGTLITRYVTVRGADEIKNISLSSSYINLGEELYLIVEYYGGYSEVIPVTADMITSGEVDFDRAGEYNGIVISYGDKTVNIWRIEIKDKNDNSPERISVRNDNLLWRTGSEGEIIPDLTGLELRVYLKNDRDYIIPITEDMISFDGEEAKAAIEAGEGFTVTVNYLGLTDEFTVYALNESEADILYVNADLYFENGVLGEKYIEVSTRDNKKYYVRLTADMIYNAVEEETASGKKLVKTTLFDLSSAKKGIYDVIIVYNGAEYQETAYVYSTADIQSLLMCYVQGVYIAGAKDSVLESVGTLGAYYYSYVDFGTEKVEIEENDELYVSSLNCVVPEEADFSVPGKIKLTVSYKTSVSVLEIELISDPSESGREEYYLLHYGNVEKVTVYKNGYLYRNGIYETYLADEENGIIGIYENYVIASTYSYYKINDKTKTLERFKAADLGGTLYKTLSLNDGSKTYSFEFYKANGKIYVDKYSLRNNERNYEATYFATFSSDGGYVTIDGEGKFAIAGESVSYAMEGETVYKYVMDSEDNKSAVIYFNDNGKVYVVEVTENEDGTKTEIVQSGTLDWVKEGNLVKVVASGIDFMVFEIVTVEGTETLVLKYSLMS